MIFIDQSLNESFDKRKTYQGGASLDGVSTMTKDFLKQSYHLGDVDQTRQYYRDWSKSYDAEIIENGYQTPRRCAEALARHLEDKSLSVLDIGCGTGLSGLAFREAGFTNLHGNDLSEEMIVQAKERDLYQNLELVDLNNPLAFAKGRYNAIAAVGVISVGHAPASTIKDMFDKLDDGGLLVFSINDPSLKEGSFTAAIDALLQQEDAQLKESEYDWHLPKIEMKSTVYVIEKIAV